MGRPGPAARPALAVVREGNQGHHGTDRLEGGLTLPAEAPPEPDWKSWWPAVRVPSINQLKRRHTLKLLEGELVHIEHAGKRRGLARLRQGWLIERDRTVAQRAQDDNRRAREVARITWRRTVTILERYGILTLLDEDVLTDYCRVVARLDQCERNISELGIWQRGERGAQKNPATTVANQLRTQLRFYLGELGLTPVARDGLTPREADGDEEDPFD